MENGTCNDISLRKDLGYSSEVNSCDSVPDNSSFNDEIIPKYLMEKNIFSALQLELKNLKQALHKKTKECEKLQVEKDKFEAEIEDLTASLFEEANKMVYEANVKQDRAEKQLAAAQGKIEALEIEVTALKSLVITSTPSNPNPTCHPQLVKTPEGSPFRSKRNKKNQIENRKTEEKSKEFTVEADFCSTHIKLNKEVDEALFSQLKDWYEEITQNTSDISSSSTFCDCKHTSAAESSPLSQCVMISKSIFLNKIFTENIVPCLAFANEDLAASVSSCIHKNLLSVELATNHLLLDKSQICSLSKTRSPCKHRICFSDAKTWHSISLLSRNRITTVCNFFTYLRYIRQGIVKHNIDQIYWEINNLRLDIAIATLGYYKEHG